jgi:thiol-disulfide isomerase/thioredoxin
MSEAILPRAGPKGLIADHASSHEVIWSLGEHLSVGACMFLSLVCLMSAVPTLPEPAPPATPSPEAILAAARAKAKAVAVDRAAHIKAGKNTKDFRGDCTLEIARLEAQLAPETRPEVRQALLVSKLFHLQLAKTPPSATFLAELQQGVPATAIAWSLDPGLLVARLEEDPKHWGAYVAEARHRHSDPALRRRLLFEYFWERLDAKDEGAWKPAYEALQTTFADSREAQQAKGVLEAEGKTGNGRPAPAFQVAALGDPTTSYNLDTFKGKFLLLDFWATWCPSCRAEMPNLHAAWAKFQDPGFEILSLSFDRKVEHIAPYRQQAATPMPWKHAFVEGGFQNPISDAYGVKGIPKVLLMGPDGRIVASGAELRGEALEKTLQKFLGK